MGQFLLYPQPMWCDEINFCCFICGTQWWALHIVIKRQFLHSLFAVFTVRLHIMQRTVLLSQFCPSVRLSACLSVCPSVRCVYCNKTKQRTANILILHETAITLVFWHQQWLVSDAPFPLKSALKVTHPPSKNADFDRFPLITSQP